MDEIRIRISGDAKDIQPTIDKLNEVGAVDKKNSEQFTASNAKYIAQSKERKKELAEEVELYNTLTREKYKSYNIADVDAYNAKLAASKARIQELTNATEANGVAIKTAGAQMTNYGKTIVQTARGMSGMVGILGLAANALGLNQDVIIGLMAAHSLLRTSSRDLSNVTQFNTNVLKSNSVAGEANIAVKEGETVATVEAAEATEALNASLLANPYVLAAAAIAAVAIGIYELGKEADTSKQQLDELLNAIENYNKILDITNNSKVKIAQNQKDLDEAMGASSKKLLKDELNVLRAKEDVRQIDLVNTEINLKQLQDAVDTAYRVGTVKEQAAATEAMAKEQWKYDKLLERGDEYNEAVKIANAKFETERKKERKKAHDDELKDLEKLNEIYLKLVNDLNQAEIDIEQDSTQKEIKEEELKYQKIQETIEKEHRQAIEIAKKNHIDITSLNVLFDADMEAQREAHEERMLKIATDAIDKEAEITSKEYKKDLSERIKAQKESEKIFGEQLKIETVKRYNDGLITKKEYDKELLKDDIRVQDMIMANRDKTSEDYIAAELKKNEDLMKIRDADKDNLKKNLKEQMDNFKQLSDFAIKQFELIAKSNDEYYQHQEELTKTNIDVQAKLAAAGKASTLAQEEKAYADLERKRQQDAVKLRKAKELEIFLNSLASFSKDDPKQAFAKALALFAETKAMEATFAEDGGLLGQINTKSNFSRRHKGGGDILVHAQTGEGILSRDNIATLGGDNAFLKMKAMLDNPMSEVPIHLNGVLFQQNNSKALEHKVDTLIEVMKNKREIVVDWESHATMNTMNVTTIEKGIKETIKHQLRKPKLNS